LPKKINASSDHKPVLFCNSVHILGASTNGTIESACKQVIRAFRAVLSELKIYADEWPEVVNMVQSVLNNSLSMRLNTDDARLHWTRGDYAARADVEGQHACQRASRFHQSAEAMEVERLSKAMAEAHA
jgi:hypothetical protein